MSDTIAVPLDFLTKANLGDTAQPLCPACVGGHLHPYKVTIPLNVMPGHGWKGVDYIEGFVAVCVGDQFERIAAEKDGRTPAMVNPCPPCGFSLPMTPRTYEQDRREREASQ
jgi:hypothetical protein